MLPLRPSILQTVARAARLLAVSSIGTAVFAACGIVGLLALYVSRPLEGMTFGFLANSVGLVLFYAQLTLAALLAPWCVHVLLAHGGNELLRALSWACTVLGLAVPVNLLAGQAMGIPFPIVPGMLALVLASSLGLLIAFSAPFFQAASRNMRWRLFATALLLPATAVLDVPQWFLWQNASMIALAVCLVPLARLLARTAPHIASMPPPNPETVARKEDDNS